MPSFNKIFYFLFFWGIFSSFIIFYPLFISIYMFLPLFIGAMSYLLIYGIEKKRPIYMLFAFLYMLNLEVSLSLPLFLMLCSTLLFYLFFYQAIFKLKGCYVCKIVVITFLLNIFYAGCLYLFDFIAQTESLVWNKLLLYSIISDIFVVVIL